MRPENDKGDFFFSQPITGGNFYIQKTMSNHQCLLTMGQETMAFMNMFMAVPKNSPYAKEINKEYKININIWNWFL